LTNPLKAIGSNQVTFCFTKRPYSVFKEPA
jgi:hypothetical protein